MAETMQLTASRGPENPVLQQIITIYRGIPLSRKIMMGVVVAMVVAGFGMMFFWANKTVYQTVFTDLSPEDASAIVENLKEKKIPFQLESGGSLIKVPQGKVYDVRLSLASAGLPKGGSVGYELFDKADFGTTEFVRKINYKRALQGELSRTIREFREVEDARVMIVLPKDSVFVEERKPASASVLLKLRREISKEKVQAIVHLVASSIEDMKPEGVTVVDTKGNVLYKGTTEEEKVGEMADSQFKYKVGFERNMAHRIQTMLEKVVGNGKAIVRVTADMDFDKVDLNEEIYDPDVKLIRSRQNLVESSNKSTRPGKISSVNPITPAGQGSGAGANTQKTNKQDETVNYELNKTIRRTAKPVGSLKRLSVAAVLDGTYRMEADADGKMVRKYIARSKAELAQFKNVVQNAMGYSEDREDQVTVESFPFSHVEEIQGPTPLDWKRFLSQYGKGILNIILALMVIGFVVWPFLKTMKEIKTTVQEALPPPAEERAEIKALEQEVPTDPTQMPSKERAAYYARRDSKKAGNILRSWISEARS